WVVAAKIAKDAAWASARAGATREKSRGSQAPLWLRLLLPVAAVAVLTVIDVRRRPGAAGAVYGIALVALYGWSTSRAPAFAPLVPSAAETVVAVVVAAVTGVLRAMLGRWLAGALRPRAS